MPVLAAGQDAVWVGRLRRDESRERCWNLFIVADNLRKGAATNAVQIAEALVKKGLISKHAPAAKA
jgi:aspartate-semialdehyde dehydrogenase